MPFWHSTENMYVCPGARRGRTTILSCTYNYPLMECNRESSKKSCWLWKTPIEINCLILVEESRGHMSSLFPINFDVEEIYAGLNPAVHVCHIMKNFLPSVKGNSKCDRTQCVHCAPQPYLLPSAGGSFLNCHIALGFTWFVAVWNEESWCSILKHFYKQSKTYNFSSHYSLKENGASPQISLAWLEKYGQ